ADSPGGSGDAARVAPSPPVALLSRSVAGQARTVAGHLPPAWPSARCPAGAPRGGGRSRHRVHSSPPLRGAGPAYRPLSPSRLWTVLAEGQGVGCCAL